MTDLLFYFSASPRGYKVFFAPESQDSDSDADVKILGHKQNLIAVKEEGVSTTGHGIDTSQPTNLIPNSISESQVHSRPTTCIPKQEAQDLFCEVQGNWQGSPHSEVNIGLLKVDTTVHQSMNKLHKISPTLSVSSSCHKMHNVNNSTASSSHHSCKGHRYHSTISSTSRQSLSPSPAHGSTKSLHLPPSEVTR